MAQSITPQSIGMNDLLKNIDIYKNNVITGVAAGVAAVCVDVANHAKINHAFTNRTYNLENAIEPVPVKINGNMVEGAVKDSMFYAFWVEFGTSRSAPYPYMSPAIEANKKNLHNTIQAAIARGKLAIKVI
jgi:HK97 gp10 family phage protein